MLRISASQMTGRGTIRDDINALPLKVNCLSLAPSFSPQLPTTQLPTSFTLVHRSFDSPVMSVGRVGRCYSHDTCAAARLHMGIEKASSSVYTTFVSKVMPINHCLRGRIRICNAELFWQRRQRAAAVGYLRDRYILRVKPIAKLGVKWWMRQSRHYRIQRWITTPL